MEDKSETVVIGPQDVDEGVVLREITVAAMLDEERATMAEFERARLARLDKVSPQCTRVFVDLRDPAVVAELARFLDLEDPELGEPDLPEVRCDHNLNRHDPCTLCGCQSFKSASGKNATDTGDELAAAHPDLFPGRK